MISLPRWPTNLLRSHFLRTEIQAFRSKRAAEYDDFLFARKTELLVAFLEAAVCFIDVFYDLYLLFKFKGFWPVNHSCRFKICVMTLGANNYLNLV